MDFHFPGLTHAQMKQPVIIAEIGTAHNGDLQKALELVNAAADAGADAVKVQVVFADEILPPEAGLVPLPGGPVPLYEVFRSLEQPLSFYVALAEQAKSRNLEFLGTPFGKKSVELLKDIGVQIWKVASPELNHEPLLEQLASLGQPLILSTGVSLPEDIEQALKVIGRCGAPPVTLLHCITSYPAPENEANLRSIATLTTRFHVPAGLSDHSLDPILLPVLAVASGAVIVEKHITLSHETDGLDDRVALLPDDFALMTAAVKRYAPEVNLSQEVNNKHLNYVITELIPEYGLPRIEAALGDGILGLAESELPHYGRTNRSIHATGPLAAGTTVSLENTALLRTEKVLRPGIPSRDRARVYGQRLVRDVASGDGITWEDLEPGFM